MITLLSDLHDFTSFFLKKKVFMYFHEYAYEVISI